MVNAVERDQETGVSPSATPQSFANDIISLRRDVAEMLRKLYNRSTKGGD